ncbi:hypothetical protein RHGRI_032472 [Rhododendron griersonianum]|uniref:Exo_endo_phos domain-containing protein n=1 Tax=Rhododendron griersonianum TaxID=479676 RepID=A0AAV6ICJ2_9ERIC|nr:hypothetical protein RHGRI_032472 [Rhododendron griersonianum]
MKATFGDLSSIFLVVVYGLNHAFGRRNLWADMRYLGTVIGDNPWIQLGDFNVVQRPNERLMGFDQATAYDFNDCLESLNMEDMPSRGFWFTWSNRRGGMGVNKSKIERVLINSAWLDKFSDSEVVFLAPGVSDHCSIVVTVMPAFCDSCFPCQKTL